MEAMAEVKHNIEKGSTVHAVKILFMLCNGKDEQEDPWPVCIDSLHHPTNALPQRASPRTISRSVESLHRTFTVLGADYLVIDSLTGGSRDG
jgi:hypothetical protein